MRVFGNIMLLTLCGLLIFSSTLRLRDERIQPVTHALTEAECAACHMAYPAAMLSSVRWAELMQGLDSHFGEDASLDDETVTEITRYLQSEAADAAWYGNRFRRAQVNPWPLRITETDAWRREHRNINFQDPTTDRDRQPGDCLSCHQNADQGDFHVIDAST